MCSCTDDIIEIKTPGFLRSQEIPTVDQSSDTKTEKVERLHKGQTTAEEADAVTSVKPKYKSLQNFIFFPKIPSITNNNILMPQMLLGAPE